jgi:hypothetical protein
MALIAERMNGETSWDEFASANPDLLVWVPAVGARSSAPDTLMP